MRRRKVPEPLYSNVFDLALAITNASEKGDAEAQAVALNALRDLYEVRSARGEADPFVTETMADYVTDPNEAIELYRIAIAQCADFPDEPVYTKQIGLASVLADVGDRGAAQLLLTQGQELARASNDVEAIAEIEELLHRVAV
jgi:hypothetical protein